MKKKKVIYIIIAVAIAIIIAFSARALLFRTSNEAMIDSYTSAIKNNDELTDEFFRVMATHTKSDKFEEQSWKLPDLTNWSCAEIAYALNNINIEYEIVFEYVPQMAYNTVVRHQPTAGETIGSDDVITLYVNSSYGNISVYEDYILDNKRMIESGEWLYYIGANSKNIYKSRIDLTERELVYSAKEDYLRIRSIAVNSEKIFFTESNYDIDQYVLFAIDFDGGGKEILIENNATGLLFIDNDTMFIFGSEKISLYTYNTATNDINYIETAYDNIGDYFLGDPQTRHFFDTKNLIYSLDKKRDFYNSSGDFVVDEPFNNGEMDRVHTLYIQDMGSDDVGMLFKATGRVDELVETDDYWVAVESGLGGKGSKINYQIGKIYLIDKNTESKRTVDISIQKYQYMANIGVWKNYLFNFYNDANSFAYDIENNKKSMIKFPDYCSLLICDEIEIYGNYVYFKLFSFYDGCRYNILLGEFEEIDMSLFE